MLLDWGNMPVNIKRDARYVQRILNWETWAKGLSSLTQVEQSTNRNSWRECHTFSHYYCICVCMCKHYACLYVRVHTLLIDTIYNSWILATLYLDTFNESWCINMLVVYTPTNK